MIKEWFLYLTTPAKPHVKKMGYLKEAIAMEARYQRCREQWQEHFQACQNAILEAVSQTSTQRTILILGAGSLRDIPLPQLSEMFQKVILVDLVFLKSAKLLAAKYANVEIYEEDVSASLEGIYLGETAVKKSQAWLNDEQIDCVVSLNLATQLPLIPASWLMDRFDVHASSVNQLGQRMIQNHLDYLNQFQAVKCLIADREVSEFNEYGKLLDQFDPAWEVVFPDVSQSWQWQIVPLGEVSKSLYRIHSVGLSVWS